MVSNMLNIKKKSIYSRQADRYTKLKDKTLCEQRNETSNTNSLKNRLTIQFKRRR